MSPGPPPDADALLDHAAFVRAVASAALRGDAAVEDVVQETYVAALGSGPRSPGALRAWLAGVARRQAAALIRKRGIRRRGLSRVRGPEDGDSTLDVAVRVETSRQIVDSVLSLDEPYRSAILLRYWDDLPPREIARRKDVPVETARTWIKRGLGQLRARLEREHGMEGGGWRALLVPLAAWPPASTAATASGAVGGVLAMKKVASVLVVVLLVAGGLLWVNRDRGERGPGEIGGIEPEPAAAMPTERATPAPSLAGRPAREGAEHAPSPPVDAPYCGRVVDPDGQPMSGIEVGARTWFCRTANGVWSLHPASQKSDAPPLEATTDVQGRFSFPATPDGAKEDPDNPCVAIDVFAAVEGYVPAQARVERDAEAELRLGRGGTLAVQVVDADDHPVAKAWVQVLATTHLGPASLQAISPDAKGFMTDEEGRAETTLPAGRYRLRARAPGYAPGSLDDATVDEGARNEQIVKLARGSEIAVRVIGPTEEPVPGALVRLAGPLRSTGQALTDARGRCRIAGISPLKEDERDASSGGGYWDTVVFYRVEAAGYAMRWGYHSLPRDERGLDLELQLVRGVRVRLRVVDDAGTPLEGVHVGLVLDRNAANALPPPPGLTTDASGWVDLPPLSPRTYTVALHTPGGRTGNDQIELVVGAEAVEQEIVLPRLASSLAGRVLLPDGSPAANGRVGIVAADADRGFRLTGARTALAADGAFQLERLEGGHQLLVVQVPGFLPQWREIDLQPGETREDVIVTLERRGRIRGRVLGWKDEPLGQADVQLLVPLVYPNGARSMTYVPLTTSDETGRFEILGLDAHPISLAITREGWQPAWPWPEHLEAGGGEAVFVMKPESEGPGMPFLARVTAGGLPYEGKLGVVVMDAGGDKPIGTVPPVYQGDGLYEVRVHLRPPGVYDLRFTAPGFARFEIPGVAIGHRPPRAEVTVPLELGAVLKLRVVDGEGRPWARRHLQYYMRQIETGEDGVVEIGGLETGEMKRLHLVDPADPQFTYAWFDSVTVPGTLDVVMRRCGQIAVALPFAYADLEHDVVLRAFDADGAAVDTHVLRAAEVADWHGPARWALKVYEDGTYRVVVERDGKEAETVVQARVRRTVKVELDPR